MLSCLRQVTSVSLSVKQIANIYWPLLSKSCEYVLSQRSLRKHNQSSNSGAEILKPEWKPCLVETKVNWLVQAESINVGRLFPSGNTSLVLSYCYFLFFSLLKKMQLYRFFSECETSWPLASKDF